MVGCRDRRAFVVREPDVLDVEQRGGQPRLPRGVLEIGEGAGILGAFQHAGEMQMPRCAKPLPCLDQLLMNRIELVGTFGDDVAFDRLFEPGPLKHRRLEDRCRGVGVVFEQLCRLLSAKGEIDAAIEAELVVAPAVGDQRPVTFRNFQAAQIFFVSDGLADQFEAHRVDLAGRRLDLALDLVKREGVIGALVPIALAVDGVEVEPGGLSGGAPVIPLGTDDALHRDY